MFAFHFTVVLTLADPNSGEVAAIVVVAIGSTEVVGAAKQAISIWIEQVQASSHWTDQHPFLVVVASVIL